MNTLSINPATDRGLLDSLRLTPPDTSLRRRQESFSTVIGRATQRAATMTPQERARDAAEQFVAVTLMQPILKQLRSTNRAAPPFGPTDAENKMGAMLDAEYALQIVRGSRFPLVDRLARDLLSRSGSGSPSALAEDPALGAAR